MLNIQYQKEIELRMVSFAKPAARIHRREVSHELPDWLHEFKENLVDESASEKLRKDLMQRSADTSRSFHELPMEPQAKVEPDFREHSVYTRFPKDPNCEIRLKTKLTWASCRKRVNAVMPKAENFGDLITADHKVLSEKSESLHNHRYAVVEQNLTTQWIQSYRCKSKSSKETQKSQMKFLGPTRKPKVIYTDNSLEFGKAREDLSWNHCTSTPHRSETNGVAERAVRRVKKGTSAMLLQSGLGNEWWADSMECYCYLRNIQDLLFGGKSPYERRFGMFSDGPVISFLNIKNSKCKKKQWRNNGRNWRKSQHDS